ncbi:MAG: hypothetical protein C4293_12470 [Nitrospiraceae bacterium]
MGKWFRTRLKDAREKARLSQTELGEKFHVSQAAVHTWESGASDHEARHMTKCSTGSNVPRIARSSQGKPSLKQRSLFVRDTKQVASESGY